MEDIYHSTNQGGIVGLVALDLRKAFDTVNHAILVHKLSYYGINSTWFKAYLSDIIQIACINGQSSESLYVETGVPQGSILGPLIFLVYLNDLPTSPKYCRVKMYSTNHVYLHRPNAFGVWQPHLHMCYETLKRVSNFSEMA